MKLHISAAVLFALAVVLYIAGEYGAGVLASGIAFMLEAKAWSQVFSRSGESSDATAKPSE
jgi:hypothetical protein